MAAVLEYLVAEVLELAGNAARDNKKKRIIPRHILLAVRNDEELNKLMGGVTIAGSGVVSAGIHVSKCAARAHAHAGVHARACASARIHARARAALRLTDNHAQDDRNCARRCGPPTSRTASPQSHPPPPYPSSDPSQPALLKTKAKTKADKKNSGAIVKA